MAGLERATLGHVTSQNYNHCLGSLHRVPVQHCIDNEHGVQWRSSGADSPSCDFDKFEQAVRAQPDRWILLSASLAPVWQLLRDKDLLARSRRAAPGGNLSCAAAAACAVACMPTCCHDETFTVHTCLSVSSRELKQTAWSTFCMHILSAMLFLHVRRTASRWGVPAHSSSAATADTHGAAAAARSSAAAAAG